MTTRTYNNLNTPQSVYIHIPFCHRLCPYCDFNKVVYKGQPVMDYLHALNKEMNLTFDQIAPENIKTIFVGGGTPTALSIEEMDFFLSSINTIIQPQQANIEFSMEANPESVDPDKLRVMKQGGVNRLSFGVQSFDEQLLKSIGRMHHNQDVIQAIETAQQIGFSNVSIDLMFGLPNQTVQLLEDSLDLAVSLNIQHVSAYSLKVEEGTHFYRLYEKNKLTLPPEDDEANMYRLVIDRLNDAGLKQYEISNFALPGYESQHNLTYWLNEPYYAFGAGAHSYVQGTRSVNAGPLHDYIELIQHHKLPIVETHKVSKEESMEDMMIMGLRLAKGVSKDEFYRRYHVRLEDVFGSIIDCLIEEKLIQTDGSRYYLTERGIFLGNEVFAQFLHG